MFNEEVYRKHKVHEVSELMPIDICLRLFLENLTMANMKQFSLNQMNQIINAQKEVVQKDIAVIKEDAEKSFINLEPIFDEGYLKLYNKNKTVKGYFVLHDDTFILHFYGDSLLVRKFSKADVEIYKDLTNNTEPIYNIDAFPGFEADDSWGLSTSSNTFDSDLKEMIDGIMDAPKPLKKTLNNNVKN